MSKITDAFKNTKAFIPFITAGDPCLSKTVEYVVQMAKAGADIIEIGIPFSDPTAEGVVIQNANIRALANGFTMEGLFDAVKQIRSQTDIPLIFMTYINPVFHYGYEAFFAKCQELSVNGFISPDVPFEEKEEVEEVAKKYGRSLCKNCVISRQCALNAVLHIKQGSIDLCLIKPRIIACRNGKI